MEYKKPIIGWKDTKKMVPTYCFLAVGVSCIIFCFILHQLWLLFAGQIINLAGVGVFMSRLDYEGHLIHDKGFARSEKIKKFLK